MRLAVIAALLVVFTPASFSQSTYPRSRGPVSDYADKLSQAQISELTSLIQNYERQTSIEIVVVVADDLQGRSAREYATGIGNAWGVGKADRNNGIVLLWAPKEREYSLRIADGLSQDLTDGDAADITHTNLLPDFRRGDYYGGLKETVSAVMLRLGNESWDERLRLRRENNESSLGWLIPTLIAALGISAALGVVIYRRRQRWLKLQEMTAIQKSIARSLGDAEQSSSGVQQVLDDFKKEMPEQDLTRFAANLAGQPERIARIRSDVANLNVADVHYYADFLQVKDRAESEASLLSNTKWKLDDIRRAKTKSQLMLERLSKESFQIADVRDTSKRGEVDNLLSNGRSLYDQAQQNSSMSLLDWMVINDLLSSSQTQIQQATQVSQVSPYTPPLIFDSGSSSSSSDTSSWSSSDFGSGGDFGGGGGFDGGSGSDGSY